MEKFYLCSLSEAGRPQWEAKNQQNKVTLETGQSLAPLRPCILRNNPSYRRLVLPTNPPGPPAYWRHGGEMNEAYLPWGTNIELLGTQANNRVHGIYKSFIERPSLITLFLKLKLVVVTK